MPSKEVFSFSRFLAFGVISTCQSLLMLNPIISIVYCWFKFWLDFELVIVAMNLIDFLPFKFRHLMASHHVIPWLMLYAILHLHIVLLLHFQKALFKTVSVFCYTRNGLFIVIYKKNVTFVPFIFLLHILLRTLHTFLY